MCYHRFTLPLRYQLQALQEATPKHTREDIARQLGFNVSTIRSELLRVTPYDAETAHQHALGEQCRRHRPRIAQNVWEGVRASLETFHSPEQIHGRCALEGQFCPSVESIYSYVYANPELAACLRKGRSRRHFRSTARNDSPLWDSITQRTPEANERQVIGHFEADLMEGAKGKGSVVVVVDRCSRLAILNLVMTKTALAVYAAMDAVLEGKDVKTLTIDQGREFVLTESLGAQWNAKTYACHAHSPWEKGSVENMNGLLRQFFPKGTDFTQVELSTVLAVQHRMNHRPRKVLGYRTPHEVHLNHQSCALAT